MCIDILGQISIHSADHDLRVDNFGADGLLTGMICEIYMTRLVRMCMRGWICITWILRTRYVVCICRVGCVWYGSSNFIRTASIYVHVCAVLSCFLFPFLSLSYVYPAGPWYGQ